MRKLTTKEFVIKAKLTHSNKYDYNSVKYLNSSSKVTITCPVHGNFQQSPNHHLSGRGCPDCGFAITASSHKYTTNKFTVLAAKLHANIYSYNKTIYVDSKTPLIITCGIHGDFKQSPTNHLSGHGCPACSGLERYGTEGFIMRAVKVHDYIYSYCKVFYIDSESKVIITCPTHGEFAQTPNNHLNGQGCPGCAEYGFNPDKPAYLYYLKIITGTNQILYKIGITNRTVNERFSVTDLRKIEIVKQKLFDKGSDALILETKIKQQYKQYQYTGPNILESGNTELFTVDIDSLSSLFDEVL